MDTQRIRLEGITSRTWEHPADRAALTVLTQVPGLADLLRGLAGLLTDKALRLTWLSTAVRSTPLQLPAAHAAVAEACRVLDVSPVPEVFVAPGLDYNAQVVGMETPFVVLGGGLVSTLTPDELLAVAGHEIGHLKAGHTVYRTLVWLLTNEAFRALQPPLLVQLPLVALLLDWFRKSELSCDRAGLLACQDPKAALNALIRVSYPGMADRVDPAELLAQGAEWEASGDLVASATKVLSQWNLTHPALVQRYAALHAWSQGADYGAILAGTLRRETADPAAEVKEAWDAWRSDLNRSTDPGTKVVAEALRQVESFFQSLGR